MSLLHAKQFLDRVGAAEAQRRPAERLMDALARRIDIPLKEVASVLGVTPKEAQVAVDVLRSEKRAIVVEQGGVLSVRRDVSG